MLAMILTILCSALLSILMRMSENRARGKMTLLSANYLTCILLAASFTGVTALFPTVEKFGITLVLGIITGIFYMLALVFNQKCIARNGVVLSSVFAKVGSLVVPLLVALCCYGDTPSLLQVIGAGVALFSIWLITDREEKGAVSAIWLLGALLLVEGLASAMGKFFDAEGNAALSDQYLLYTFGSAFLISAVAALVGRERPCLWDVFYGVLIGVANFFASRFMLQALKEISSVIFYPTRGVMVILVITLAGILLFHEKLRKKQWIAMGLILVSVALLNL